MKVLLINGSPHKKGCTWTALNEGENPQKGKYRNGDFLDRHQAAGWLYCVQDLCKERALHV